MYSDSSSAAAAVAMHPAVGRMGSVGPPPPQQQQQMPPTSNAAMHHHMMSAAASVVTTNDGMGGVMLQPHQQHQHQQQQQYGGGGPPGGNNGMIVGPMAHVASLGATFTPNPMSNPSMCLVCGDTKSLGKNYGGWTCTGCKSFFRRCIEKQTVPRCKYGGHCEIDLFMRRKCPECRLKKCFRIGMRMDLVTRDDSKPTTTTPTTSSQPSSAGPPPQQQQNAPPQQSSTSSTSSTSSSSSTKLLNGGGLKTPTTPVMPSCMQQQQQNQRSDSNTPNQIQQQQFTNLNSSSSTASTPTSAMPPKNILMLTNGGKLANGGAGVNFDENGKPFHLHHPAVIHSSHQHQQILSHQQQQQLLSSNSASSPHDSSSSSLAGSNSLFGVNGGVGGVIGVGIGVIGVGVNGGGSGSGVGMGSVLSPSCSSSETKSPTSAGVAPSLEALLEPHQILIQKLVHYQELFDQPTPEDISKLTPFSYDGHVATDQQRGFQHFVELTILSVQLIVRFAKHVPGFETLSLNDQIILLKESSIEVLQLRTARRYDIDTDSIFFSSHYAITRECYSQIGFSQCAKLLFSFCRHAALMQIDTVEYALLTALCIFSQRPGLENSKYVEECQSRYLDALTEYVKLRRGNEPNALARLLMIITKLRNMGFEYSQMVYSLQMEQKELPPLIEEMWNPCNKES